MKKKLLLVLLFFVLSVFALIMFGCKGDKGDTGATGPTGAPGTPGTPGDSIVVTSFQKEMYPSPVYVDVIDSYIGSDSLATLNYGDSNPIFVGFWKITSPFVMYSKERAVIKFDLNYFAGQNITVKNANLTLFVENCYISNTTTVQSINVAAYKLLNNQFTEDGVTWGKYDGSNAWTNQGGDYDPTPISNKISITPAYNANYVSLNLDTSTIQSWINNPTDNKGLILIADEENNTINSHYVDFASSNTGVAKYRPKLNVYYTLN